MKDVVRYAASIKPDLISIMNLHEKSLMGILGQTYEQQIITNEAQLPVLIINPIETRVIRRFRFRTVKGQTRTPTTKTSSTCSSSPFQS